jgi:tetratricopeptide (TPR) repeat protein
VDAPLKLRTILALLAILGIPVARGTLRAADAAPSPRVFRLERWMKDLLEHVPGQDDGAVEDVRGWSSADSETLRTDEMILVQLTHDPKQTAFPVSTTARPGTAAAKSRAVISYTSSELRRLKVLSCVATGKALPPAHCAIGDPVREDELDAELKTLNDAVRGSTDHGDPNFVLRRGALLHGDAEMLGGAVTSAPPSVTGSFMVQGKDGQQTGSNAAGANWEAAEMLLDAVTPTPDPMVLLWYRATASWMQREGAYRASHIDHGSEMFRNAADILFLSGCQHEVYASPRIQALTSSAVLPPGRGLEPQTAAAELAVAETYFKRALANSPGMAEARLRLGHVLLARGKPDEAVRELQLALPSLDDPLLKYFGEMFLGAADEATKRPAEARAAYSAAEQLFPSSQSAPLALSALAARQGDRASSAAGIERMFVSAHGNNDDRDPWWGYYSAQTRGTDALLAELYGPFRHAP